MAMLTVFRVAAKLLDWRARDEGDGTATPSVALAPAAAVGASTGVSLSTTNATQLASATCTLGVWVSCPIANTAAVYVGDSTVTTTTGIELQPGDREFFPVSNANLLYVRTGTATQSVRTLAV